MKRYRLLRARLRFRRIDRVLPHPLISFGSVDSEIGPCTIRSRAGRITVELEQGATMHHVYLLDVNCHVPTLDPDGPLTSITDCAFERRHNSLDAA